MHRGDFARAALEFRNAARIQPKDARAEYQLALAYLADGKLSDAVTALVRSTQLDPKYAEAQVKLAELMISSGNIDVIRDGQKHAQDALATAPDNVDALNALALSELELRKPEEAERHLQEALKQLPQNLQSSVELASLYLTQGKLRSAEQILKAAVAKSPQSVDGLVALGELYRLMERWSDAAVVFREALQKQPKEPRALLGLAAAEVKLGQADAAEHTYRVLSALPGTQYRHLHAFYLFATGQQGRATKELEQLVKEYPADRENRTRLTNLYLLTGRVADAEKILNSALKTNDHDVDALLQRSRIFLAADKPKQAESDLNQVLHYKPDSAEAHYLLSRVYGEQGNQLRRRSELGDALRYNPGMLLARTELAQLLTVSNSPNAALDLLNAAPAVQKELVPTIVQRNWAKLASGDKAGFRAGVEGGLGMARVPDLLLQDAMVKLLDRDYPGARRCLQEVLQRSPEDLRALRGTMFTYTAQKQPGAATQFLQQYAAQHEKSAPVQEFAGDWLWAAGAHAEARAAYAAAKAANPDYTPADLALASLDLTDGRLDTARATLKGLLASNDYDVNAHLLLAMTETKAGNYPVAVAQYRKVVALSPENWAALNNLAYLLADTANNPDDALPFAQEALEAAPTNPDAAGTLGWVFYRKGQYELAKQYLREAVSNDKENPGRNAAVRKYHLAMTYIHLGDRERGAETLASALRQNPDLPEAKLIKAALKDSSKPAQF